MGLHFFSRYGLVMHAVRLAKNDDPLLGGIMKTENHLQWSIENKVNYWEYICTCHGCIVHACMSSLEIDDVYIYIYIYI
jgi:hypothetical protein